MEELWREKRMMRRIWKRTDGTNSLGNRTDRKSTSGYNVGLTDLVLELLNTKWRGTNT